MDITTRTQDDVTLIAFTGKIDTNTTPEAQQALDAILAAGVRKIAVDFTSVVYISSTGLRALLYTGKRLNGIGGTMHMFGLNDTVEEVFEISGFNTLFKVFPDEAAALAGF